MALVVLFTHTSSAEGWAVRLSLGERVAQLHGLALVGGSFIIYLGCSLGVLLPGLPPLHQTSRLGAREASAISVWAAQPVPQLLQAASDWTLQ